ncbi:hypothetical protein [Streptomyces sp. Ncost-T10-10d]|nr:hypothetical protein GA0115254_112610 [Streptomyces sp. Ncost-T10-10d]
MTVPAFPAPRTAAAAAGKTIPSWTLVAIRDKAVAPDLERFEA